MNFKIMLSPEERELYLNLVKNYELSSTVLDFVERYEAIGGGEIDFFGNGLVLYLRILGWFFPQ